MADKDLSRSIKIYIDGTPAAEGIKPVQEAISKLEGKLASLDKAEAGYEEKSKKLKKELESKNRTLQNYQKKVQETDRILRNLSGATYRELIAVHKQVKEQLQSAIPGTQKYNTAMEQNRRVTEAMTQAQRAMRVEVGCQGTAFGKAANLINKYAGLFTTTVASVTGLSFAMRKSVNDYAQMQEAMANVKKYTGMTDDEVKDLNEDLKKMDTRTSREALNGLASDAGRLGIQGKKDILEFIDAADKINVALGEDLGEDAVKNIGKLAQMFGEDKTMGLRGAMLATGSAINEVAQSSSAAEAYLVEFTARVAGVAHQAGISQANIIGFAASMDENMLRNETSATAYQKILMKMFTDTEKFAQVAGLNVQEFSELVKKDANEALLTFATAISQKGGMADLAPLFGDLKTEGAGVASVLSVMAGKTDEIRNRQQLANKAYREGTSIINEYNVQNNTVQAGLDKAKKGFLEVSVALGEKLLPLMSGMISGTSLLVRGLNAVVSVGLKFSGVLVSLTTAITAYYTAAKLAALYEKHLRNAQLLSMATTKLSTAAIKAKQGAVLLLTAAKAALTGNIGRATAAMKLFNTVTKASPVGIIVSLVATLGVGLYQLVSRTGQATASLHRMNEELLTEQTSLESLFAALKRTNPGSQERARILQEINDKYGQYLPYLLDEKSSLDDINAAYKRINTAIVEQIALKYKNEEISSVTNKHAREQMDAIEEVRQSLVKSLGRNSLSTAAIQDLKQITAEFQQAGMSWEKAFGQAYHTIQKKYFGDKSMAHFATYDMEDYVKSYYKMQQEIVKVNRKYESWMPVKPANEIPEVTVTGKKKSNVSPSGSTPIDEKEAKKAAKERLKAEKELIADLSALRDQALADEERKNNAAINAHKLMLHNKQLTEQQYAVWEAAYSSSLADRRLSIEEEYAGRTEALVLTNGELKEKAVKDAAKRVEQAEQQSFEARLKAEQTFRDNIEALKEMAAQTPTTPEAQLEAEYSTRLKLLEAYYQASLDYAERNGQDEAEITELYDRAKLNLDKEYQKKKKELVEKSSEELKALQGNDISQQFTDIYNHIEKLKEAIDQADFGGMLQSIQGIVNSVLGGLSNAFNTFKQIEIDNIEAKYDAEIEAAQGNTEEVERLEQEKAEKKLEIEKKYADVQFAVKASQIIANTALAIMMALAQLGPIAGPIAAGLMAATGAIQLAAANAEREKVKNMTLSGSESKGGSGSRVATGRVAQHASGSYDVIGEEDNRTYRDVPYIGPSPTGIVRSPALISENGAELIVNAEDLKRLQQHVNYPLVLQAIHDSRRGGTVPQHADGNYSKAPASTPAARPVPTASGIPPALMERLANAIIRIDEEGIPASVTLSELERKQELRNRSRNIAKK